MMHMKHCNGIGTLLTVMLMAAFFLAGCGTFSGRIGDQGLGAAAEEARGRLLALDRINETLATFKGTGKVALRDQFQRRTFRVAWMGAVPGQLRFELLAIGGQRVASLASDGHYHYLRLYREGKFYKQQAENTSLRHFIALPIKTQDLIALLSGRFPIADHDAVLLERDPERGGDVLKLVKKWGRTAQKIYLDPNGTDVAAIELFDALGGLRYSAEYGIRQTVDGYRIPFRLTVAADDGNRLTLEVDQYWADPPVNPAAFVLQDR